MIVEFQNNKFWQHLKEYNALFSEEEEHLFSTMYAAWEKWTTLERKEFVEVIREEDRNARRRIWRPHHRHFSDWKEWVEFLFNVKSKKYKEITALAVRLLEKVNH